MADNSPGNIIAPQDKQPEPSHLEPAQEVSIPRDALQASVEPVAVQPPADSEPPHEPEPVTASQTIVTQAPEPPVASPEELSLQPEEPQPNQFVSTPSPADPASTENSTYVSQAEYLEDDQASEQVVRWTASEYVSHHKSSGWYIALAVVAITVAAAIFFITDGDLISTLVVIVVAIVFGMYAARKPRIQEYAITNEGVFIGPRAYPFADMKSFAVMDEGPFSSITFMPLRRFMPLISIYYDPADEDRIVDLLSRHLPVEHRRNDPVDRFMKKIRF
jgi:hypothetical protein